MLTEILLGIVVVYLYLRLRRLEKALWLLDQATDETSPQPVANGKDAARDVMDKHLREYHQ